MSDDDQTTQETPDPNKELQERLASLTASVGAVQENTSARDSAILEALEGIQRQLQQQAVAPQPAQGGSDWASLFAPQPATPAVPKPQNGVNLGEVGALVQAAVAKAVKPLSDELQANKAQAGLREAHRRSFIQASRTNPRLNDPGSAEAKAFEQIWEARPDLRALPDAPVLVSEIARSLAMSSTQAVRDQSMTKKQAATVKPTRPFFAPSRVNNDAESTRKQLADLREKGAKGELQDTRALADLISLDIQQQLAGQQDD